MNKLIESAKTKLKLYNIGELCKKGIQKRRFMKGTSSNIIVTCPPLSILPKINPQMIFKDNNKRDFSLYFHIPFCTGKCLYCGFLREMIFNLRKE